MTDENQITPDASEEEMHVLHQGECTSVSGRSVLTFQLGRRQASPEGPLYIRIAGNSGGGVYCRDWVHISFVEDALVSSEKVSAKTFRPLWPGRSINNGGFMLAVLKQLGGVRRMSGQDHLHEPVKDFSLQRSVEALIAGKARAPGESAGERKKKGRAQDAPQ